MAQHIEAAGSAMDEEPSSPTLSSPTPAASTPASSQPTYTTAGTIYNPSSSQRLQPPARRGRLLKLNSEASGFPLDAAKFGSPRSMLSDTQFRSDASAKVPAAAAIQQYSPLQQNYDRAVSPVISPHHEPGMSSQALKLQNGPLNLTVDSPPLSLFDEGKGKAIATDNGDFGDNEDDPINSALMNMTVKSLQNLASYPNPNQKDAQKVLLRGTRPKASSSLGGGPSRLSTPFTYRNISPCGARLSASEEASIGFRPILSDPSALYQRSQDRRRRSRMMASEAAASGTFHSAFESRLSTPSTNSDSTDPNPSASMHLATGPGAPKPLTAGPPGQRQYRPSTFESTFKALTTRSTGPQGLFTEVEDDRPSFSFKVFNTVPSTPQGSAAEDEEYMSAPESAFNASNAMPRISQSPPGEYEGSPVISPNTLLYLTITSDPEGPRDKGYQVEDLYGYPYPAYEMGGTGVTNYGTQGQGNFASVGSGASRGLSRLSQLGMYHFNDEWDEPTGPMFPQSMGYPGRLTTREIEEHNRRLNFLWYAASREIDVAQYLPRPDSQDANRRVARNIYGAVGDGRPRQTSQDGFAVRGDGAWPPRSMSLKSVNSDVTNGLALLDQVLSRAT